MKTKTISAAMAAICAAVALPSFATTYTWNGANGADWATPSNWLDGGSAATAPVFAAGATATYPDDSLTSLNAAG